MRAKRNPAAPCLKRSAWLCGVHRGRLLLALLLLASCRTIAPPQPADPKAFAPSFRSAPSLPDPGLPRPQPSPKSPSAPDSAPSFVDEGASAQAYDAERPCFSRNQMRRAEDVLFNRRPKVSPALWLHALNRAFYELRMPCGDAMLLLLVLTTIQVESGVAVDPPLANKDLAQMFRVRIEQLRKEQALMISLMQRSGLYTALLSKLRRDTERGTIHTEGDLVRYVQKDLKPWVQRSLMQTYALPQPVARYVVNRLITSPIETIGPMQVHVGKAYRNALKRGEQIPSQEAMRELLLNPRTALYRGLKEGAALLWRGYRYYRHHFKEHEAARFTAADYNAGEFSSRNAAFQERIGRLANVRLTADGDLLIYDNFTPLERSSRTEIALRDLLPAGMQSILRRDLLLEKSEDFERTKIYRWVCVEFQRKLQATCRIAMTPGGASNERAQLKLGRDYSPSNYVRAHQRRLLANRRRFASQTP